MGHMTLTTPMIRR